MGREPWLYHTVASPLEARSSRKWANIIYACLPKYVNMPPAFSFFFFNEERPAPLLFCPQVTLCGWQDVKIHLLTDSSSIIHSKFINIRACRAWRTLWTIYRDTPLPQHQDSQPTSKKAKSAKAALRNSVHARRSGNVSVRKLDSGS